MEKTIKPDYGLRDTASLLGGKESTGASWDAQQSLISGLRRIFKLY